MKLLKKSIGYIGISFFIGISSVPAIAADKQSKQAPIEYKCHVELYGGSETIHFVMSSNTNTKYIAKTLIGKRVDTTVSKKKQDIYQVNECVKLSDSFKSKKAQNVDEETVR